jgi:hypothetical protein
LKESPDKKNQVKVQDRKDRKDDDDSKPKGLNTDSVKKEAEQTNGDSPDSKKGGKDGGKKGADKKSVPEIAASKSACCQIY